MKEKYMIHYSDDETAYLFNNLKEVEKELEYEHKNKRDFSTVRIYLATEIPYEIKTTFKIIVKKEKNKKNK